MSWSILGFIWYRFTSPDRILRVEGERDAEAAEEQEAREAAEAAERKALARINKEYGEVYDEVKGCEAAVERLHSNEPEDMMEAASVVLSSHKILWGDDGVRRGMKSETGYGEGERRKMFGMFASRENGGVSLRRLAEDPMKEVCEAHGIAYDSREAMDALLDVLQAAAVPSDIRKYIEKRRMAQALELKRQEDAYLREQYEEWCREMYHMSADEYEAYEEYMSEELKNLDENFDEKEYFDNIADEISNIEKNGYREIQKDASEREGGGNGGSGEVLSAERAVQRGGDATDAGQPGLSERDGIQGDGAKRPVLESTPGRSEVRPGFDGGVAAAEGAGGQGLRPGGAGAEQAAAAAAGDGAGAVSTELDENGHPFILSKDGTTGPNGEPTVSGGKGNALPGDTQANGAESSEPYTITATTYTNKRGKTSDVYFVKFGRELTAGEMDAAYDYIDEPLEDGKKTKRGWYDRKQGGYMMRSEEAARGLGELIGGGEADSEGAVVAGVADVAEVNAAHQAVRDMLVAKGLMREGEGLDLIVNSSNDMEDGAAITGLQAKVVRKRMEQALGKDNPTYQDVHDAVTNTVSRAKVNVNGLSFLYEMLDKFNSGEVTAGEFMDVVESMFHLDKRGQAMPEHQAWVRRMAASGRGSSSGPEGADKPDVPAGPGGVPVLEREDFKASGKRRSGGKKPKGAVNRVDLEGLMGELSGTGEASLADHSEPVESVKPADKPKGGFRVTEEMRQQEEELRKLLGIGDDEGDRGERFRDPDSMTPAEKRMVFRLGVDYAFNFLDNGITGFEDFAKAVTGRLGSKVKPFVKSWYEGAKRVPGYGGEGYTPSEEVDRFDIENFDRPGTDVFREAEMRAAEHKARKAAEQAEREMIEEKRKRIEGDERRAEDVFGEAERVAREARENEKPGAKGWTLKPTSILSTTGNGAKLQYPVESAKSELDKLASEFQGVRTTKGFIAGISQALGSPEGLHRQSFYYELARGENVVLTLRLSNHNANADNHDGKTPEISIVIKSRRQPNRFHGSESTDVTEYVYFKEDISTSPADVLSQIARDLIGLLETGEYRDTSGVAVVNRSGKQENPGKDGRQEAVKEATEKILNGGKVMKTGGKDVTLKPETASGDLFAGLYDEGPKEENRDEKSGDGTTRYRDGEDTGYGERLRAIRALEPIEVEGNDFGKVELREIYANLPDVEKDGRLVEFYRSAFKKIYKEGGLFGQVVPVLDDFLDNSVLAYSEADKLGGMVRPDGTIQ